MGMFQAQNYGADFVNAMSATSGMMNDRRKLDMAEKEQAEQNKRYAAEAETRGLQNAGLRADNAKKATEAAREKLLTDQLDFSARANNKQLKPEDYGRFEQNTAELMKVTPYLPSDPADIPKYKQALGTVMRGIESIRTLPASNYQYTREDNIPEVNATLDAFQLMLSKDRLGKTFTDADGSVTGKAGATYKTSGVGGFAMMSGEGNKAAFTPLFTVTDEQGKPLVGANGKAVMVPSTEGATNGPQDRVRQITPEEIMTKAGFAYKVLNDAESLGLADEDKRKKYFYDTLPAYMGEEGAKEMLKRSEPKKKGVKSVDPTHDLVDEETGKVITKGVPKEKEDKAPTTRTVKRNGYEVSEEYTGSGKWKEVAKNKIKEPKSDAEKEAKGIAAGQKRTVKEVVDEYQAIKTSRSSQFAKDSEELRKVNADRAKGDASGQPLPPLTFQQYFGSDQSKAHKALTDNMYQLRDVARDSLGYDLINMKPYEAKPAAKKGGMAAPAQKATPKQQTAGTRPPLSSFMKGKR
jgi:hypothetical protein